MANWQRELLLVIVVAVLFSGLTRADDQESDVEEVEDFVADNGPALVGGTAAVVDAVEDEVDEESSAADEESKTGSMHSSSSFHASSSSAKFVIYLCMFCICAACVLCCLIPCLPFIGIPLAIHEMLGSNKNDKGKQTDKRQLLDSDSEDDHAHHRHRRKTRHARMDDSDSDYEHDRHQHRRHHHRHDYYDDDYNHDSHPSVAPNGSNAAKPGMLASLMEMMPCFGKQGYQYEQQPNYYYVAPPQGPAFYASDPPLGSCLQEGWYPAHGSLDAGGPPTRGSYDMQSRDSMMRLPTCQSESMREPTIIREIIHEPVVTREVETVMVDQAGRVVSTSTAGGGTASLMASHSMHGSHSFAGRPYSSVAPSYSRSVGSVSGGPLVLEDGSLGPHVIGETVHKPVPVEMPLRSIVMSMPGRTGSMRMVEPSHHWF